MLIRKLLVFILPVTMLSTGCVVRQEVPRPAIQITTAATPAQGTAQAIKKSVVSGTTLSLGTSIVVNHDCTSRGLAMVSTKQQPSHGVIRTFQKDDYPNFPQTNPHSACNKNKLPGIAIEYTPVSGFTGTDVATMEVISPDGDPQELDYIITVLPPLPSR
jgi:hypothetical protein